jgi:2'-5' RNA ligase
VRAIQHRAFFALLPEDMIADRARRLAIAEGLTPAARPHVSLVGFGDGAPSQPWIDKAAAAAGRVHRPPFLIELNTLSTFGKPTSKPHPIVLRGEDGVIGVNLLCEALLSELAGEGLGGRPPYAPHLTIAWGDRVVAERHVQPMRWTAREFVLIHSLQGAGRHEVLGRWPLVGGIADASKSPVGGN